MSLLDIVKMLLPLLFIVGLLYGALVMVRKYGIKLNGKSNSAVPVNVLSSQMIMPKKYISIVRVHDKLLVLGVSENSITLLKELEDAETAETKTFMNGDKNNFLDLLKKNLGIR